MSDMAIELITPPEQRKAPADSWRPPADVRLISADDHTQEMEHLFEEYLPAKFKARAPKVWRDKQTGLWHTEIFGRSYDTPGVDAIGQDMPAYWDPAERLKAMDSEHIDATLLYHGQVQILNAIIGEDPELYIACMDAYNEWLADHTKPYRDRLHGVAMLPSFVKPEGARDMMQKIKALGFKAVQMPSYPKGVRYNSRELDPVWAAIVEAGVPLTFHVTAVREFSGWGALGANLSRNLSPFRSLLGQLMFSGVFERHPDLKCGFVEAGLAWAADGVVAMDKVMRSYYDALKPKLPHLPSFYWKRQCFATFMEDPVGLDLLDYIGAETAVWSLDFPHAEGVFGYAGDVAKSIYDKVGHEKAKLILGGNAARIYGI